MSRPSTSWLAARPLPPLMVGEGRSLLLLPGFAMQPRTYLPTARLLAAHGRVVIPPVFALPGPWTFGHALDCLEATLDELELDRISLLAHSFSGGLALGLATRRPARISECIFADTLAVRDRFRLADEALRHPLGILALATPSASRAFAQSVLSHPLQLATAALWGFASDRNGEIRRVAEEGIPSHVLWAGHDTLLARADGQAFARELGASFTVASERVEHDWVFERPQLFVDHLERLKLRFFGPR